jgi:hypothetical protein
MMKCDLFNFDLNVFDVLPVFHLLVMVLLQFSNAANRNVSSSHRFVGFHPYPFRLPVVYESFHNLLGPELRRFAVTQTELVEEASILALEDILVNKGRSQPRRSQPCGCL